MQTLSYYAKAIVGALYAGLMYLTTVLAPSATLGQITLLQWIGFIAIVLGTFGGVAVVTNGPKPAAKETPANSDGSFTVTTLPASSPGSPALATGSGSVAQSDAVTPTPDAPATPPAPTN